MQALLAALPRIKQVQQVLYAEMRMRTEPREKMIAETRGTTEMAFRYLAASSSISTLQQREAQNAQYRPQCTSSTSSPLLSLSFLFMPDKWSMSQQDIAHGNGIALQI
jgi:hypothetical protein